MRSRRIVPVLAGTILLLASSCRHSGQVSGEAAPGDGWGDAFVVDTTKLVATGKSPWFSLIPGSTLVYEAKDARLTITVLDETVIVDGVTARVVEEREEEDGELVEVSRNFFALDPATGDLYYFGEDVDDYEDGRVVGHSGVWRSGAGGARFGLLLPGKPFVGQRFYQEIAPGVAMDRAEIVGIDETVRTPAGTFEHAVHLKETTPLEKGSSHKWFAPGVGLVKDDEFDLASIGGRTGLGRR